MSAATLVRLSRWSAPWDGFVAEAFEMDTRSHSMVEMMDKIGVVEPPCDGLDSRCRVSGRHLLGLDELTVVA